VGTNYRLQDRTMTFKPAVWYPIAVVLSVGNLIAIAFTAGPAQPWHAASHAALALAFGLWAQRLRQRAGASELPGRGASELEARFEAFEADLNRLRQELSETQERLDFVERLLAKAREERRIGS
jgi:hypothetical protein